MTVGIGGKPNGYGQYCPMSRALEVVGERWSLLIVRDLLVGASRFNDLARGLPGLSRTLLSKRLRQLERDGIVERRGSDYVLTEPGRALEPVVFALGGWGSAIALGEPEAEECNARLLVWWISRRLDPSVLPEGRRVVHFRFTDDRHRFWILIEAGEPSVRAVDPGCAVDVTVTCDVSSLLQVWQGRLPLREALRSGRVEFSGPTALVRRMPALLLLSPFAERMRTRSE